MASELVRIRVTAISAGSEPFYAQYGLALAEAVADDERPKGGIVIVRRDLLEPVLARGVSCFEIVSEVPE
jgi:hypothetical protein